MLAEDNPRNQFHRIIPGLLTTATDISPNRQNQIELARALLLRDSQMASSLNDIFPHLKCSPSLLSREREVVFEGIRELAESAGGDLLPPRAADIVFADTIRRRTALQLLAGLIGRDIGTCYSDDVQISRAALNNITGLDSSWLANTSDRSRQDLYDIALEMHRTNPSPLLGGVLLSGNLGHEAVEFWASINALFQVKNLKGISDLHDLLLDLGATRELDKFLVEPKSIVSIIDGLRTRLKDATALHLFADPGITTRLVDRSPILCALCRLAGNPEWSPQIDLLKGILINGRKGSTLQAPIQAARDEWTREAQLKGLTDIQQLQWRTNPTHARVWHLESTNSPIRQDWVTCRDWLVAFCDRYADGSSRSISEENAYSKIAGLTEVGLLKFLKAQFPAAPAEREQFLLACLRHMPDLDATVSLVTKIRSLKDVVGLPPQAIRDLRDAFDCGSKARSIPFVLLTTITDDPFAMLQVGRWVEAFSCLDPFCGRDIQMLTSNALDENVKMMLTFALRPNRTISSSMFHSLVVFVQQGEKVSVNFDRCGIELPDGQMVPIKFAMRRELFRIGHDELQKPGVVRERAYAQGHIAIDTIHQQADQVFAKFLKDLELQQRGTLMFPPSRNPLGFYSDLLDGIVPNEHRL